VLADVLPDTDWLLDAEWLGEVCGGQVTEGSMTRLPWSSKMALDILQTPFSTGTVGSEGAISPSVPKKLPALVNTKNQVNVVYRIICMIHGSLIVSSSTPVAMLHAQKQVNLGDVSQGPRNSKTD
jgi:hypothetical protein